MKLKVENYEQFKRYIISQGDCLNGDRCVSIDLDDKYDFTLCFDDDKQSACICEVYHLKEHNKSLHREQLIAPNNSISLINRLIELSKDYVPDGSDESAINLYINEIEPNSTRCDLCFELDSIS